jgi:hypothetical protein
MSLGLWFVLLRLRGVRRLKKRGTITVKISTGKTSSIVVRNFKNSIAFEVPSTAYMRNGDNRIQMYYLSTFFLTVLGETF